MQDLDQLIREFRSSDADRCWIVAQLQEVPDEPVVSLLVNTLENPDEDDDVRIEILRSLVVRRDSTESNTRMGRAVLSVLRSDNDVLIRQFAANALRFYPEVEGVVDCLESLVLSEVEDIDVRHNALTAIASNRAIGLYRETLRRLTAVPELGRHAQRALDSV